MIAEEDLFEIGRFVRPHGVKGEITLFSDFDIDGIFENGDPFVVCTIDGINVPFFIESARAKSHRSTLVKIADIDTENAAKSLCGKAAYIFRHSLPESFEEIVSWKKVERYIVSDPLHGEIGTVRKIDDSTMNTLIQVMQEDKEILIPAAFIKDIDHEKAAITVTLPEGFLDL